MLLQLLAPINTGGVNQVFEIIRGLIFGHLDVEIFAFVLPFGVGNREHIRKEFNIMVDNILLPYIATGRGGAVVMLDNLAPCYLDGEFREIKEL